MPGSQTALVKPKMLLLYGVDALSLPDTVKLALHYLTVTQF